MWAIGALLYTMCTTGFIRCIEGVKIIPGIAAKNFDKEEKVDIMLNKLTCVHTQISLDYYAMPFCKPKGRSRGMKGAVELERKFAGVMMVWR